MVWWDLFIDLGGYGRYNFSGSGLSPARVAAERQQWANALEFYQQTKVIDISYNGYFYSQVGSHSAS